MARIRSRSWSRAGFTLIEMVIVLGIIILLASLLMAGVYKVMVMVPQVQTRTEISEMEVALSAFMTDYNLGNVPPPSYLILCESLSQYTVPPLNTNPAAQQSFAFLQRAFGKNLGNGTAFLDWNGNLTPDGPHILEGEMCLVFYLGGIPDPVNGQCLGFSPNNFNPTQPGGNRRNGPYYTFVPNRLVLTQVFNPALGLTPGFFLYIDPWKKANLPGASPYAYFSSSGNNNQYNPYLAAGLTDCQKIGANAWFTAVSATGVPTAYVNPNKYQILSAGKDGLWGDGNFVGGTANIGPSHDDQANFSSRILGADQQ